MLQISDAVLLMAGTGSRLRGSTAALPKPLLPIAGRPLISYAIDAFEQFGVVRLHTVVGANASALLSSLQALMPDSMELRPIHNPQWEKQNGVSVLNAAGRVGAPFFLAMGDHLFEPAILERLLDQSDPKLLNLAIDRKIDSVFDLDDAMKLQTQGNLVVAIGKDLALYDAIDTGLFLCPQTIFDYLRSALKDGDCGLADGVRLMAADRKVQAIDIGAAWWQDVDTPEMLTQAEQVAERLTRATASPSLRTQR